VLEVEQGSDGEIQQSVYAILMYEPGHLLCLPKFGMPEPTFSKAGVNISALSHTILQWEPRADELIDRDPNWYRTLIDTVTIRRNYS
jgi:hypothetical protein